MKTKLPIIRRFKVGDLVTLHDDIIKHLGIKEGALGIIIEVKGICATQFINEAYLVKWHHNPYLNWDDIMYPGFLTKDDDVILVYYGYELQLVVEEE